MIVIVPARGGSKGVPGKNIRMLAGKPLIAHTLECARAASQVSRVIVSTDDERIAEAAMAVPGVEVPFRRPTELSGDAASAVDVYLHTVSWLATEMGQTPEAICALLPTAPLRRPEDVDACISLYRERKAAVVLSVTHAKPAAWQQMMAEDGRLRSPTPEGATIANRQDYGRLVVPNGAVYVLDPAALSRTRTYFGPNSYGYLMPSDRSIDIDGEDDLRIAEALLTFRMVS